MVFPIILGSGNPKTNTNNKQTHLHHEKKYTKRPPPPDLREVPPPAVSFFASAQLAPSTQSQHQSRSMSSLCCGFSEFQPRRSASLPGFLSFRLRLVNPLPTAERFVIPVGEGFREAMTPDTGPALLNGSIAGHRGGREIFH